MATAKFDVIKRKIFATTIDNTLRKSIELIKLNKSDSINLNIQSASLSLTENCNSKCITCNHWKRIKKKEDHLPVNQWKYVISQLVGIGVKRLFLTGGEPLLYKGIFDLTSFAKEKGINNIELQTNGLLLDKYREVIPESGITQVNVSIDGMNDTNDKIRGINGYYKNAIKNLEVLRLGNKNLTMTLLRENIDQYPDLKNLCNKRGWGLDINLPDTNLYFDNKENVHLPDRNQVEKFLGFVSYKKNHKGHISEYFYDGGRDPNNVCIIGTQKIYVGYSGDVYSGCYVLPRMGNLREKTIREIMYSDKYKQRIIQMIKHNCPGCTCGYRINLQFSSSNLFLKNR